MQNNQLCAVWSPNSPSRDDFVLFTAMIVISLSVLLTGCERLDDPSVQPGFVQGQAVKSMQRTPAPKNTQRNLYFGDLHIHTSLSTDAYVFGVRSQPEDVYTFAKGGVIEHAVGYPIQIDRPLDFAAVTDHAEYLGQARLAGLDIPTNMHPLRDVLAGGNVISVTKQWLISSAFVLRKGAGYGVDEIDLSVNRAAWQQVINAAEAANVPGEFSAFIGYEWTSFVDNNPSIHIHRNVIYRGSDVSDLPYSALDSNRPEDLWRFLEGEQLAGKEAIAISHNANISAGNMYSVVDSDGEPLTDAYARLRNRYEPISEILQIKGASETHPMMSNLDEFASFELLSNSPPEDQLQGSYARSGLRLGLETSARQGFNPYQFGVIGSSDSHNASSPSQENRYHGKLPVLDGTAGLRTNKALLIPELINPAMRWGSGGLAAVWAEENTRGAVFDALRRRECYATSGPRISVRLFGGWQYTQAMLDTGNVIEQAYKHGVPMGGQLGPAPKDGAPTFMIIAAKDPEGANLDRVQIIKAWVDSVGESHEKVYDVAAAGGRTVSKETGKLEPVGNTVDAAEASYSNTIGAASLAAIWRDPDFDVSSEAVYYARVIEIPTPRWSTYDAKLLGDEPMNPAWIQERAITSAIWYSP